MWPTVKITYRCFNPITPCDVGILFGKMIQLLFRLGFEQHYTFFLTAHLSVGDFIRIIWLLVLVVLLRKKGKKSPWMQIAAHTGSQWTWTIWMHSSKQISFTLLFFFFFHSAFFFFPLHPSLLFFLQWYLFKFRDWEHVFISCINIQRL